MTSRCLRSLVVSLAVLCTMLLSPLATAEEGHWHSIIGSWQVIVFFDDHRPDVPALYTFDPGHTFSMGGSWPALFGPGHGVWSYHRDSGRERDDGRTINLTFFRLLYNSATGAFNDTLKVQAKLTLSDDGQSFTGRYLLTNFDPTGNVRSTATGDLNAVRIVLEPLP